MLIAHAQVHKLGRFAVFINALLFIVLFNAATVFAQVAPPAAIKDIFPDPAMADAISRKLGKYHDENPVVTQEELAEVTDLTFQTLQSLAGCEFLTNLQTLSISNSSLRQLPDTLPASLLNLYLYNNQLTQLPDTLPAFLEDLSVDNNQLTRLPDTLPASLGYLNVSNNQLTRLPDTLPASLEYLRVGNNQLTQLPDTLPASLETLWVENNQLTQLPDTLPASLETLWVENNQLTQLPDTLPASLENLWVENNQLTQLPDTLPASLSVLDVVNNQLTQLPDTLPASLGHLNVSNNQLTQLPDTLPASLVYLDVSNNQLTQLPNTLPAFLDLLNVDNNQLTRLPDTLPASLKTLSVNNNQLTLLPDLLPSSLEKLNASGNRLTLLPESLPDSVEQINVSRNQLTKLPDSLPPSLVTLYAGDNQLSYLPTTFFSKICILYAEYNQLVDYPWPMPEGFLDKRCFRRYVGGMGGMWVSDPPRMRNAQWVTLPTIQRSLGSSFQFDDFAPPILQHFKNHAFWDYNGVDFAAGTLAKKGQWTLTAPDESIRTFAAGDGSEINSGLFTSSGLYRLSFEVTTDDGYFNLNGSTYTRAIVIDELDPQANLTMRADVTTEEVYISDDTQVSVYADLLPKAQHLDQEGALFIFAYIPEGLLANTFWLKGPFSGTTIYEPHTVELRPYLTDGWRFFSDCSSVRPVYKGKIGFLQKMTAVQYRHQDPTLPLIPGAIFFMGYGVGETAEQACIDLITSAQWQVIYALPQ